MMFFIHSSFALQLIAFAMGVSLLIYVKNHEKIKSIWAKVAAWFVIILSLVFIICSSYSIISLWSSGDLHMKNGMMKHRMHHMYHNMDKEVESNEKSDTSK